MLIAGSVPDPWIFNFATCRPVAVPAGHELDAPHPGVPGQLHQDVQQGWIYWLEERSTKGEHSIKMFNRENRKSFRILR